MLLCGESGTGKEMMARQLHRRSRRACKPFVPVDCTNLSGELFSSQLFGHVKGAFTGADRDTLGFFRAADGGTIFLDEVGELSLGLQAKLLRVLQDSRVTPVGATTSYPVDVRLICATNRSLEPMVREGTFRNDLYYRINVINLRIPPLRERRSDILPLAEHFLQQQANLYDEPVKRLEPQTRDSLLRYPWPGNVRELANVMEHAHVMSPGRTVPPAGLPLEIMTASGDNRPAPFPTLAQANKRLITQALQYTNGRKLAAAGLLGLERRRLNRLIRDLGIEPRSTGT